MQLKHSKTLGALKHLSSPGLTCHTVEVIVTPITIAGLKTCENYRFVLWLGLVVIFLLEPPGLRWGGGFGIPPLLRDIANAVGLFCYLALFSAILSHLPWLISFTPSVLSFYLLLEWVCESIHDSMNKKSLGSKGQTQIPRLFLLMELHRDSF